MDRRAILLDRDGTLLETDTYLSDPAKVRLVPGAARALGRLGDVGWKCVVVSNQSGVARGLFTEQEYSAVEQAMVAALRAEGGHLDGSYACFHLPDAPVAKYAKTCECRKPKPGLLLAAARLLGLDLARSVCVGDDLRDLEAGRAAGCWIRVLVRTGKGAGVEKEARDSELADGVIDSLADLPAWLSVRRPLP
jgi:D-glycero-D-manno-heptose 1,7-bisphosphate phosphatase